MHLRPFDNNSNLSLYKICEIVIGWIFGKILVCDQTATRNAHIMFSNTLPCFIESIKIFFMPPGKNFDQF